MTAKTEGQRSKSLRDRKLAKAKLLGLVNYRGWVTPESKIELVKIELELTKDNSNE